MEPLLSNNPLGFDLRSRKLAAGEGSDLESNDFEGEPDEAAVEGSAEVDTAIAGVNEDKEEDDGGTAIGEEEEHGGTANGEEVGMTKDGDEEMAKGDDGAGLDVPPTPK